MSNYGHKAIIFSLIQSTLLCTLYKRNATAETSPNDYNAPCWPLNSTLLPRCFQAGINASFVDRLLPFREDETELSIARYWKGAISSFAKENNIENCSNYSDLILCSLHLPQCVGDETAFLPCRRVCQEFVTDCGANLSPDRLDYFVGVCHFLPENGSCMEPLGFKSKYNSSGLPGQTCLNLITPQCRALNYYNYTIASYVMQQDAEQIIDDILPTETENCRPLLTKFLCAELVSPCFPDAKEPAIYLPCNTTCYQLSEKCPTFFTHYTKYFHACNEHPPGDGEKGFCKIAHWDQLLDVFFTHKKAAKNLRNTRTRPWRVPVAVIVPLAVLIPIVVTALILWKIRNRGREAFKHKTLEE